MRGRGKARGSARDGTGFGSVKTGTTRSVLTGPEKGARDVGGQDYPTMRKTRPRGR